MLSVKKNRLIFLSTTICDASTVKKTPLLEQITELAQEVSEAQNRYWLEHSSDVEVSNTSGGLQDNSDLIFITPHTPLSPLSSKSESTSDLGSESKDDSITSLEIKDTHYHCFLNAIHALQDEIQKAHIIHSIAGHPFCAPCYVQCKQLLLLSLQVKFQHNCEVMWFVHRVSGSGNQMPIWLSSQVLTSE